MEMLHMLFLIRLTTLAALVVTERPPKKNEPHMMKRKTIAPAELWYRPWNASYSI